ncbi:hypothetical protein QEJ31_07700 [Pigmentibacter sp. JX0631]|uniref:hypothetical protein n=1 Tax=Pigmentibacter sp. JX0631 TaxID=2976982 RepID=UPI002469B142|nr:hypothetical protein [Pigmentibacter sp. JX0631]WGL61472.1 hypothetical protein QEJ31_07700 [Pigmentibacter sp. JX0631]
MDLVFDNIFKNGILDKYKVERITPKEYWEIFYDEFPNEELNKMTFIREALLTDEQKVKRQLLEERYQFNKIENYIKVMDGNLNIALFRGEQKSIDIYYMRHAIVKREYRKYGIYNDYLDKIIHYCKERGFLQIISCFVLSNINIYRTKIKKDFYLTGIETHAEYGQIGWLCHFLHEDLKKAFFYRCGNVEFSKNLYNNSEKNAVRLLNLLKNYS